MFIKSAINTARAQLNNSINAKSAGLVAKTPK